MAPLKKLLLGLIFFTDSLAASYIQSSTPNSCALVTTVTTTATFTSTQTISGNICKVASPASSASTPKPYYYQVTNGVTSWINGKPTGPVIYNTQPVTLLVTPIQTAPDVQYVTVTVTAGRGPKPKKHETKIHTIASTLTKTETITKLETHKPPASYATTVRETVTMYRMTTSIASFRPPAYLTSGLGSGAAHSTPSFVHASYGPQRSEPVRTMTPTRKLYQPLLPSYKFSANHYTLSTQTNGGVAVGVTSSAIPYSPSASTSGHPLYSVQPSRKTGGAYGSQPRPHYGYPASEAKKPHPQSSKMTGQHTRKMRPAHKTRTRPASPYDTNIYPCNSNDNAGYSTRRAYPTRRRHHTSHSSASVAQYETRRSLMTYPSPSAYNHVPPAYHQPEFSQPTYQPATSSSPINTPPGTDFFTSSLATLASSSASSYLPLATQSKEQQYQHSPEHLSTSPTTSCDDTLQSTAYLRSRKDATTPPNPSQYRIEADRPAYQTRTAHVTQA